MNLTAPTTDEAFERFMQTLQASGVRDALAYLLGLTDYRFISIFRFEGGKANAAVYVDRENPQVTVIAEVPESATYCCYVRDSHGVFTTADAMADPRLADHPARDVVPAYCGVPVLDTEGTILGTLCHYDLQPRDPEQVDLALMFRVASALAQGNHVPPYPHDAAAV